MVAGSSAAAVSSSTLLVGQIDAWVTFCISVATLNSACISTIVLGLHMSRRESSACSRTSSYR
eukprot:3246308-Pleurochrysis_carterae.AAC.1